ncbi:thyroid hormone receptor-associated protein 3-like [Anopheles darlingi]|uniref:thyroid hormone receptor-associated protein 3-like n=1 Tax=Anopheles darlingi TaxID=43151 RepID=UPI0021001E65|nr:thyroid hormone receptor-associated protein 3-like [Anopheles darlingi]
MEKSPQKQKQQQQNRIVIIIGMNKAPSAEAIGDYLVHELISNDDPHAICIPGTGWCTTVTEIGAVTWIAIVIGDRERELKRNESPRSTGGNNRSRKAKQSFARSARELDGLSAYLEERNEKPVPISFIQRNSPKDKSAAVRGRNRGDGGGKGAPAGGKRQDLLPPRRRSRSRSPRDRRGAPLFRSRSHSQYPCRSPSRDRRQQPSSRDRNVRNRQHTGPRNPVRPNPHKGTPGRV